VTAPRHSAERHKAERTECYFVSFILMNVVAQGGVMRREERGERREERGERREESDVKYV